MATWCRGARSVLSALVLAGLASGCGGSTEDAERGSPTLEDTLAGTYEGTITPTKVSPDHAPTVCSGPIVVRVRNRYASIDRGSSYLAGGGSLVGACFRSEGLVGTNAIPYAGCFAIDDAGIATGSGTVSQAWSGCEGAWVVTRQ